MASARYTEIVVAKRDLPLRTLLKKDDLRLVKIPRSAKEEGDLTCLEDAVGMVLAAELAEGQRLKKETTSCKKTSWPASHIKSHPFGGL